MRRWRTSNEKADPVRIRDLEVSTGIETRPKIVHERVEVEGHEGEVVAVWVPRERPNV